MEEVDFDDDDRAKILFTYSVAPDAELLRKVCTCECHMHMHAWNAGSLGRESLELGLRLLFNCACDAQLEHIASDGFADGPRALD
jgi:hypothetical protein